MTTFYSPANFKITFGSAKCIKTFHLLLRGKRAQLPKWVSPRVGTEARIKMYFKI